MSAYNTPALIHSKRLATFMLNTDQTVLLKKCYEAVFSAPMEAEICLKLNNQYRDRSEIEVIEEMLKQETRYWRSNSSDSVYDMQEISITRKSLA